MPKFYNDYSDIRGKAWCFHCAKPLQGLETNQDHIPSKSLLDKPYPDNLISTKICKTCNSEFSLDEEYVAAFFSAVLSGTTEPEQQKTAIGSRILNRNEKLRTRIEKSKSTYETRDGQIRSVWKPDLKRIENVIVKNARGHLFYEFGEPLLTAPHFVEIAPIEIMSEDTRRSFFNTNQDVLAIWPEVGSRWMQRLINDPGFDGQGFYVVQPEVYRFKPSIDGSSASIKIILREWLAATVSWNDDNV